MAMPNTRSSSVAVVLFSAKDCKTERIFIHVNVESVCVCVCQCVEKALGKSIAVLAQHSGIVSSTNT